MCRFYKGHIYQITTEQQQQAMLTEYQTWLNNLTNMIDKKAQEEPYRVESALTTFILALKAIYTITVHLLFRV